MYRALRPIPKRLDAYVPMVGEQIIREVRDLAEPMRGARVLNLAVNPFGRGHGELVGSAVALMRDLGLEAQWQVMRGAEACKKVNDTIGGSLTGRSAPWTADLQRIWQKHNAINAAFLDREYDLVIVHDPQLLGLAGEAQWHHNPQRHTKWIWDCHSDLRGASAQVMSLLRPHIRLFDAVVLSTEAPVKRDLGVPLVAVVRPAIDPLDTRSGEIPVGLTNSILGRHGIDPGRPLISQVSAQDHPHELLATFGAYEQVKKAVPNLQLALVALMGSDDHQSRCSFELLIDRTRKDPDVHLISTLNNVGSTEINAIQRGSSVVIQNAPASGFSHHLAEAQWKAKPVVLSGTSSAAQQVIHGVTGFVAEGVESTAKQIAFCLRHEDEVKEVAWAGKEHVREHHLVTRYLGDYLKLLSAVVSSSPLPAASIAPDELLHAMAVA